MNRVRSRHARRLLLLAIPTAALAGCAGLSGRSSQVWWEWVDAGASSPGSAAGGEGAQARAATVLAVEGAAAGVVHDGTALLFSRSPGMLAPYQYASWTERPASRLARLAQHRLRARGGFRDVVPVDAGVAPDLLLTLTLGTLHHSLDANDLAAAGAGTAAGNLVLSVTARLVDWRTRRPIAERAFEAREAVAIAEAAGAVEATGRAGARVLDALALWVEQAAAAALAGRSP
jgi:ABC-type uncharacterized transport system auxiliary subunit